MTKFDTFNIEKSQEDYLNILQNYKNIFSKELLNLRELSQFLDELRCFWLERLEIIEIELERLVLTNSCFLLCGAIILDIEGYEHFYFKSFGDKHILFDPLLKIEHLTRVPENRINVSSSFKYIKRV